VKEFEKSLLKRIKQCVNNDIYNKGALILVEYTILEHLYFCINFCDFINKNKSNEKKIKRIQ
ncbi:hypothetical protein BM533_22825, partial [Clostridioides difficile]